MCTAIGVDPLVGGGGKKRGGWGVLGVGEFWLRVGTRVVGICRRTRAENGGIISLREVREILAREDRIARRQLGAKDVVEITEYNTHCKTS